MAKRLGRASVAEPVAAVPHVLRVDDDAESALEDDPECGVTEPARVALRELRDALGAEDRLAAASAAAEQRLIKESQLADRPPGASCAEANS